MRKLVLALFTLNWLKHKRILVENLKLHSIFLAIFIPYQIQLLGIEIFCRLMVQAMEENLKI